MCIFAIPDDIMFSCLQAFPGSDMLTLEVCDVHAADLNLRNTETDGSGWVERIWPVLELEGNL